MQLSELLKYILLAIIQGISEILPISSSGHLIITQEVLGLDILNMSTSIFLHIGSLLAVLIFYRKTLINLGKNSFNYLLKKEKTIENKNSYKVLLLILLACLPAGIIGLLFKSKIEDIFTNTIYIGINLIITGILLFFLTRKKGTKDMHELSYIDAIKIGLFQAIGVLPGISRSGITTIGGKVVKLKDDHAVNFAFLLFIPITIGTGLLEIIELLSGKLVLSESQIILYSIGMIVSFIVTYFALKIILKIIKKGKFHYFSFYCLLIGLIVIILHL